MSTLEYTVYNIRRGWRACQTFLFAGAFAAAVVGRVFSGVASGPTFKMLPVSLFAIWAVVFGLSSSLYPLIFVLVAFLVVYTPPWVGFTLVALAIGIEFALVSLSPGRLQLLDAFFHSIFIVFFALINLVFTRTELARIRRFTQRQIEKAKAKIASDARDFRLTTPAREPTGILTREQVQARLSRSSVGEVRRSMYHHVDLLKRTMGLHTSLFLWLDAEGENLRILECGTEYTSRV